MGLKTISVTMTSGELRALLEGQGKEALVAFLLEMAKEDPSVASRLRILFSDDWLDEAGSDAVRDVALSAMMSIGMAITSSVRVHKRRWPCSIW